MKLRKKTTILKSLELFKNKFKNSGSRVNEHKIVNANKSFLSSFSNLNPIIIFVRFFLALPLTGALNEVPKKIWF